MRREWIEICRGSGLTTTEISLPPCGGSGLKFPPPFPVPLLLRSPSMRREWIEIMQCTAIEISNTSPSMRREWIEIASKAVAEK